MIEMKSQESNMVITLEIKRAATGLTEVVKLVCIAPTNETEEIENERNSQHSIS
jgi:hypothetical protein